MTWSQMMKPLKAMAIVAVIVLGGLAPSWGQGAAGSMPGGAAEPAPLPRSHLVIETQDGRQVPFEVEVATTPQQRAVGLMYRKNLPADAGMLFVWGDTAPRTMWMKNTLVALDMLFLDDRGWIVHVVRNTKPQDESLITAPFPAAAVLEINAGTAELLSLEAGDRVRHPLLEGGL
ncbi:DUF192 domain-containing protein [Pararhodospirillum oryzae]|uniref:DUF192 domain-containing protein n=1 Tax=Pararhodospirillum oryzae TaxID=478448 RepID=A0A512HB40_9PROT|nr:DUF192 domain-containing protein [Pararhodospirillum oryzae]GEO82655.1 hypothetical protein ROR02_27860 [Pararhodospirillum oryzae]